MTWWYPTAKAVAFRCDAEWVHERALHAIERGWFRFPVTASPALRVSAFGVDFDHPLGLAAGFDKNAVGVHQWRNLGFSHAEIGTVTYHGQAGNPKPRLFRVSEDRALINRMGFNNEGAAAVSSRLASRKPSLPIGINLGKSKVTPNEDAPAEYANSFRLFKDLGQYFVINVSSPNTPGLRELQERSALTAIIRAIQAVDAAKPLLVKVAPDLTDEALADVVAVARETRLTGIIANNTTIRREVLSFPNPEAGGISGEVLRDRSREVLAAIARTAPELTLIAVGGISTADEVWTRITLGAHLCQLYTGWVYGGPDLVARIVTDLNERVQREGVADWVAVRRSAL